MNVGIPKIIHYCWFGRGEKPKKALKCIESWEKYCPDYKLVEWNEDKFDINSNKYVLEAYEAKKYAFVTDYVRLYAMYTYGGVYMDTDVEVIKSLDIFLDNKAFSGFELPDCVPTGIMASIKGFKLYKEFLEYYNEKSFLNSDGSYDTTTNVTVITNILEKYNLEKNGEFQIVEGFAVYPRDYFCPLDNGTGKLIKTENTATIHWFAKSWVDKSVVKRSKITRIFHRVFGNNCFSWLKQLLGK